MVELIEALAAHPDRWRSTPVRGEREPVEWFPIVRVNWIGPTSTGVDRSGRWILGEPNRNGGRKTDGFVFEPTSSSGFLYLTPMLDWLPPHGHGRRQGHRRERRASARNVIHSALESGRMQYVKAVDWMWHLGVLDDYRDQLDALVHQPRTPAATDLHWLEEVLAQPSLAWAPVDST